GGCSGDDEALWRAAGTEVVRLIDDPEANALSAQPEEVARLVGNLLDLDGDETGAGWITWSDGTTRPVTSMEDLVAILGDLQRAEGHLPDLSNHPFPALLSGTAETAFDQGLCRRLPALVDASTPLAVPFDPGATPAAVTVLDRPVSITPESVVRGAGLLLVRNDLFLPAGARLEWRGALVLAGGRILGPGRVDLVGGLIDLGGRPAGEPGLSLQATRWKIVADVAVWKAAWRPAGTVVTGQWDPDPVR
ncbi:MAG: hypothetical protein ACE5IK_07915, partial [Acidobacteriota bacterium]